MYLRVLRRTSDAAFWGLTMGGIASFSPSSGFSAVPSLVFWATLSASSKVRLSLLALPESRGGRFLKVLLAFAEAKLQDVQQTPRQQGAAAPVQPQVVQPTG